MQSGNSVLDAYPALLSIPVFLPDVLMQIILYVTNYGIVNQVIATLMRWCNYSDSFSCCIYNLIKCLCVVIAPFQHNTYASCIFDLKA